MHVNDNIFSLALQTVEMVKHVQWIVFDLAHINHWDSVWECDVSAFKVFGLNLRWIIETWGEAWKCLIVYFYVGRWQRAEMSRLPRARAGQPVSKSLLARAGFVCRSRSVSARLHLLLFPCFPLSHTHTEWPFIVQMCVCVWGKPLRSLPNARLFFPAIFPNSHPARLLARPPSGGERERRVRLPWFPDMRRKHNDSLCEIHTTSL